MKKRKERRLQRDGIRGRTRNSLRALGQKTRNAMREEKGAFAGGAKNEAAERGVFKGK